MEIKSRAQFKKMQRLYTQKEITHEQFVEAKEGLDLDKLPEYVEEKPKVKPKKKRRPKKKSSAKKKRGRKG